MASNSRLILALTGSTGQIFGWKALQLLAEIEVESHLICSSASRMNIKQELPISAAKLQELSTQSYDNHDLDAPPAQSSWNNRGMLVAPCSMNTLASIARGRSHNLIARAAERTLTHRRPLVLMPREKPLNRIHLQNMLRVHDAGAVVMPPLLSFYVPDTDLDEMIGRTMKRALACFDLPVAIEEWKGMAPSPGDSEEGPG